MLLRKIQKTKILRNMMGKTIYTIKRLEDEVELLYKNVEQKTNR